MTAGGVEVTGVADEARDRADGAEPFWPPEDLGFPADEHGQPPVHGQPRPVAPPAGAGMPPAGPSLTPGFPPAAADTLTPRPASATCPPAPGRSCRRRAATARARPEPCAPRPTRCPARHGRSRRTGPRRRPRPLRHPPHRRRRPDRPRRSHRRGCRPHDRRRPRRPRPPRPRPRPRARLRRPHRRRYSPRPVPSTRPAYRRTRRIPASSRCRIPACIRCPEPRRTSRGRLTPACRPPRTSPGDARPAPPEPAATIGMRAALNKGSLGLVKLPPGRREQELRQDVEMVRRNFGGLRQVTVVNPKGGAGKTVAILLLAMTFGQKRGGYVLAWDNNETQGTLGMRAQQDFHSRTVRDLLRDLGQFRGAHGRVGDLSQYVRAQGEGMFDVLASDESATAGEMLTAAAFARHPRGGQPVLQADLRGHRQQRPGAELAGRDRRHRPARGHDVGPQRLGRDGRPDARPPRADRPAPAGPPGRDGRVDAAVTGARSTCRRSSDTSPPGPGRCCWPRTSG